MGVTGGLVVSLGLALGQSLASSSGEALFSVKYCNWFLCGADIRTRVWERRILSVGINGLALRSITFIIGIRCWCIASGRVLSGPEISPDRVVREGVVVEDSLLVSIFSQLKHVDLIGDKLGVHWRLRSTFLNRVLLSFVNDGGVGLDSNLSARFYTEAQQAAHNDQQDEGADHDQNPDDEVLAIIDFVHLLFDGLVGVRDCLSLLSLLFLSLIVSVGSFIVIVIVIFV